MVRILHPASAYRNEESQFRTKELLISSKSFKNIKTFYCENVHIGILNDSFKNLLSNYGKNNCKESYQNIIDVIFLNLISYLHIVESCLHLRSNFILSNFLKDIVYKIIYINTYIHIYIYMTQKLANHITE